MTNAETCIYKNARAHGYIASEALSIARTVAQFRSLECGEHDEPGFFNVRLRAEYENENYFDVFGTPEAYADAHGRRYTAEQNTKRLEDELEQLGVYWVVSEYWGGAEWQHADSIGMCVYNNPCDPIENCYVPQLMRAALAAAPYGVLP